MDSFFEKIHTEHWQFSDFFILALISSVLLVALGQLAGDFIITALFHNSTDPFISIFGQYFSFIGIWIVVVANILIWRRNRPIIKTLGPALKNNNVKYLGLGLLIGFAMNGFCILIAWLNKDIALSFSSFEIGPLLALLFAVFVQSSAEELVGRCFGYYRITRGYRSRVFAVLCNSILFASLHLGNPGISALPIIELFLTGIMFGFCVLYFDSLWMAFGIHTMWNYTQNIIFGLPNSGVVTPYSVFRLDAANARQSFAYGPEFGIEGSVLSILLHCLVTVLLWYIGTKKQIVSYDPWLNFEADKFEEE